MEVYYIFSQKLTQCPKVLKETSATCFHQNTTGLYYKSFIFNHRFTVLFIAAGFSQWRQPLDSTPSKIGYSFEQGTENAASI